jgi:membrane protease YdiL (CAAX protease family)
VEESMVRGLVLTAMLISWGGDKKGQVKAVLLSSSIFGIIHLFNLIIRPPQVVLFQVVGVVIPGILYASILLAQGSIWPAILLHWATNAAVNIKLIGVENYQETFSMWLKFVIGLIPVLAYAIYLMWMSPDSYKYKNDVIPANQDQN